MDKTFFFQDIVNEKTSNLCDLERILNIYNPLQWTVEIVLAFGQENLVSGRTQRPHNNLIYKYSGMDLKIKW